MFRYESDRLCCWVVIRPDVVAMNDVLLASVQASTELQQLRMDECGSLYSIWPQHRALIAGSGESDIIAKYYIHVPATIVDFVDVEEGRCNWLHELLLNELVCRNTC